MKERVGSLSVQHCQKALVYSTGGSLVGNHNLSVQLQRDQMRLHSKADGEYTNGQEP